MEGNSARNQRKSANILKKCITLLKKGRAVDAANLATKVVKKNPKLAIAHLVRGRAYLEANRTDDAIKSLKRAISLSETGEAYSTLARAHELKGRIRQTLECFTKALELDSNSPSIKNATATFMINNGMLEEAEVLFMQTAEMGDPNGLNGILLILDKRGEHKEAIRLIENNIDVVNGSIGLQLIHSKILLAQDFNDDSLKVLGSIDTQSLTPNFAVNYYHLIGDIYHSKKVFDKAFEAYSKANNLRGIKYEKSKVESKIADLMIRYPDKKSFSNHPNSGNFCERPVFIVGMPRSGTSLLEQILTMHSEISGAGELDDINEFANTTNVNDIESLKLAARKYEDKLISIDPKTKFITDKMPHNVLHAGFITQLFPASKLIYCRRIDNDVMMSCFRRNFHGSHEYATSLDSIKHYMSKVHVIMEHWKRVLPLPIFELNYEELVSNPKIILSELLDFLNLSWEESLLNFHKSRRQVHTASYDQVRKPLYRTAINSSDPYLEFL